MFAILFIFLCIFLSTITVVWLWGKHMVLSDMEARKIEIFGYILLFVVIIWEFVVKNILMDDNYNGYQFYITQKLLIIFHVVRSIYDGTSYDTAQATEYFRTLEWADYTKHQMLIVNIIEAVLQIGSAVCIAIGRFQDIKNASMIKVEESRIAPASTKKEAKKDP